MPRLLISAAHKSSGKTTLTLGLCAALTARGTTIQPFKKGPDYIDPLWLSQAAKRPCYNLDFYTMEQDEISQLVAQQAQGADLSLIEGNKGLYDSIDVEGHYSNAALARLLGTPVLLVLDTQGMTRGIVPLLLGYQAFEPDLHIAGVILNQVGGQRHERKLRTAITHYTDIPVLGAVQRDARLVIKERHLGLIPSNEMSQAQHQINTIRQIVAEQVDLAQIMACAQHATALAPPEVEPCYTATAEKVQIGVVRDAAFGFYYPGDLAALQAAGATLVFIDALQDTRLPPLDGLFIGGGFPETHMITLAKNQSLKQAIYAAVEAHLPVYAECGGLMYLSRRLTWRDEACDMVGALPLDTVMADRPQGRGYVHLQETGQGLWPLKDQQGQFAAFHAHEFHYSRAINLPMHLPFAYRVLRGTGLDGQHDGLVYKNTLASYAHLRDVNHNHWTQRFIAFVRAHRRATYPPSPTL